MKFSFEKYYEITKEEYIKDGTEREVAKHWFKKLTKNFSKSNHYAHLSFFNNEISVFELDYLKNNGWELISHSETYLVLFISIYTYYFKNLRKS